MYHKLIKLVLLGTVSVGQASSHAYTASIRGLARRWPQELKSYGVESLAEFSTQLPACTS